MTVIDGGVSSEQMFTDFLNDSYASILEGETRTVQWTVSMFDAFRAEFGTGGLPRAQSIIREHPIFTTLLTDPYTHRAFTKPRGFAGDAELIDLFYGFASGPEFTDPVGRQLFQALMRLPSCDAVRFRRAYYGQFIDSVSKSAGKGASLLSIACGHLREATYAKALTSGEVTITGIDSDPMAVACAREYLSRFNVDITTNSVIDFIRRRGWGMTFDGIYSSGLFDYLDDKIARKVLETSYRALKPGGTISVANFQPGITERGYMDIVMDWQLIYRTPDQMLRLADNLGDDLSVSTWTDPMESVVYLSIEKAR